MDVTSLLYPASCVLCAAPGDGGLDLCSGCWRDLPHNLTACPRCALPLPDGHPSGAPCAGCSRRPPPFAGAHAAFRYEEPVTALIAGAKFRSKLNLARLLGQCLARSLAVSGAPLPELIVPVPLHDRRLRERGYNQALEIARPVSAATGVPVDARSCARRVSTPPQSALEQRERRRNVRGVFAVERPPGVRHLAILDDVITTGSTVSELARVLLRAGVQRVDVWAVARTP